MNLRIHPLSCLAALALALLATGGATVAAPGDYFRITVVDEQTGRGVPLVELRAVSETRYYTDSSGIAAIGDPEMMGQKVYFRVSSPGYEYPADGFGYHGLALSISPGGSAVIKVKRLNIAERLYRITGSGIYRDSILVGQKAPLRYPLLDGQVVGQDTVEVTPYQGKIYWFFGDTNRPSFPLGQFATSGATSLPPGHGGLDPSVGVDLTYWTDPDGFSKKMIPLPGPGGPVWVGGLFTLTDAQGHERLLTHYARVNSAMVATEHGLAMLDDAAAQFKPIHTYDLGEPLVPEGHPFRATAGGKTYLYFEPTTGGAMPLVRAPADITQVTDPHAFEGFTCLVPGSRFDGENTKLDRGPDGHLVYAWKANTPALSYDQQRRLIASGKMRGDEAPFQLRDIETDAPVQSANGSTFWNPYRRDWVMIMTQSGGSPSRLGEVWFAEADTPAGPWLYAKKIVTHGGYTFYNPTQHPFFDQDGGRLIYFEGTYTDAFSDVKDLTPRYNYNQLMYRLNLADPRLSLPAPVYRLAGPGGAARYATGAGMTAADQWASVQSIPFYAVPPGRAADGLIPVYAARGSLTTTRPAGAEALFFALPTTPIPSEKPAPEVVPLYEYTDPKTGRHGYAVDDKDAPAGAARGPQSLCRVWRNPSSVLTLDAGAKAVE